MIESDLGGGAGAGRESPLARKELITHLEKNSTYFRYLQKSMVHPKRIQKTTAIKDI